MNRPHSDANDDEPMQADERLRAALRHAPDAQQEPPAAVTAHILSTARAAAARAPGVAGPASVRAKRRPGWGGLAAWPLARPGLALGLVALLGVAALGLLQRPQPEGAPAVDLQASNSAEPPVQVAQAEVAEPVAPAAIEALPPPRRAAVVRKPAAPARAERQAAVPQIVVMSPAPPPPAAFKPAPAPAAEAPPAEHVVVTASAARASQAPAAAPAAPVEREPSANPVRAWLAATPEAEPAQRVWMLALADATEGRWQDELPPAPLPQAKSALAETRRDRASLPQALAPSAAPAAEEWLPLGSPGNTGRRASLRWLHEGLLWCEAGRCRYAPLSAEEWRLLRKP